jgi:L-cysteate sulfo-lyase
MKFSKLPRTHIATLPTPLQYLSNLTKKLGGPHIWIKRDDLTGLAFGGNKARKLEYILGDALSKEADARAQRDKLQVQTDGKRSLTRKTR